MEKFSSHPPVVQNLLQRLEAREDAVDTLAAHAHRLPRSLVAPAFWRFRVLLEPVPNTVLVLVAQTQATEFTALAFSSDCVQHLLGYVAEQPPRNLAELVFILGEDTEHAIGALLSTHRMKPLLTVTAHSAEAARDAAAARAEEAGYTPTIGIRNEVVDEMVEMIARAGARQYFMADISARSPILSRLAEKARLKLTSDEFTYLLDL